MVRLRPKPKPNPKPQNAEQLPVLHSTVVLSFREANHSAFGGATHLNQGWDSSSPPLESETPRIQFTWWGVGIYSVWCLHLKVSCLNFLYSHEREISISRIWVISSYCGCLKYVIIIVPEKCLFLTSDYKESLEWLAQMWASVWLMFKFAEINLILFQFMTRHVFGHGMDEGPHEHLQKAFLAKVLAAPAIFVPSCSTGTWRWDP